MKNFTYNTDSLSFVDMQIILYVEVWLSTNKSSDAGVSLFSGMDIEDAKFPL